MLCKFCHNADMIAIKNNKQITVEEVIADFSKYQVFYKNGGITVSGGEPLLQLDFLIELFRELKKMNIHTCIETQGSLYVDNEKYKELISLTDLFLVNLKGVNNEYAVDISGVKIDKTFVFLERLNNNDTKFVITYVLLPGINDNDFCSDELGKIIASFREDNMTFQVLPYHSMGIEKWDKLNIKYLLRDLPEPKKVDVDEFVSRVKNAIDKYR